MPYLTRRALDGLKAYQYKPSGYTMLDHAHAPALNCELGAARRAGAGGKQRACRDS